VSGISVSTALFNEVISLPVLLGLFIATYGCYMGLDMELQ
jgi:hypothetical protein